MARRKWKWTSKQFDKLNKVTDILQELADYKPLTLRQVYYQLVGKGFIDNKVSEYNMLSKLLKWARIDGYVSWADIEDRVRSFHNSAGWHDKDHFITQELNNFLKGYRRDLLQGQERYIECWIEKDALSSIFTRMAGPYSVSVVVCIGFSSVSFLNDFRQRLTSQNRPAVMLYFGDFDPSGLEMLQAMQTTFINELGVRDIEFKRMALLQEDISLYNLPHKFNALKMTDTRAKKHIQKYGHLAVELDALRPDILEAKIKNAIESELNIEAFNHEVRQHFEEIIGIKKCRQRVVEFMGENLC